MKDLFETSHSFEDTSTTSGFEDDSNLDSTDTEALRPWLRPGKWFAVQTQSGLEQKAQREMLSRVRSLGLEDQIFEVISPTEEVVEFKKGKKQVVEKKMFPVYLLVRCEFSDASWLCIRQTPGITGFVGQSQKNQRPTPLSRKEVERFLSKESAKQKPRVENLPTYETNTPVKILSGPFADFLGVVASVDEQRLKLQVIVNIFGRETPVEMDYHQVELA